MTRPATGSAHHRPKSVLSSNPASRMAERYVQNSVCLASACMAALPSARPTFRLARESKGITTSETQARTIPGMLCSGARRDHRSNADSWAMYAASRRKQTPTILRARLSFNSRRCTSASTDILHNKTDPDVTSTKLSIPKPTSEMLPAITLATTATKPSNAFHAMVKYSSLRPWRTTAGRSKMALREGEGGRSGGSCRLGCARRQKTSRLSPGFLSMNQRSRSQDI
jgi:hypothetical protein